MFRWGRSPMMMRPSDGGWARKDPAPYTESTLHKFHAPQRVSHKMSKRCIATSARCRGSIKVGRSRSTLQSVIGRTTDVIVTPGMFTPANVWYACESPITTTFTQTGSGRCMLIFTQADVLPAVFKKTSQSQFRSASSRSRCAARCRAPRTSRRARAPPGGARP